MAFVNRLYRIIADNTTDIILLFEPQESFAYITPLWKICLDIHNDFYANPKFYTEIVLDH